MLKQNPLLKFKTLIFVCLALFLNGCGIFNITNKARTKTVLDVSNATNSDLLEQVDNLAKVDSMRAKMDLKFEDNTEAGKGIAEKYKTADGEVVVQRPAKVLLRVKVPIIKTDVAQMTSDGEKFRVAILQDGGSGKYKKFIKGTNNVDYSLLQEKVTSQQNGDSKEIKKNVNAFSNLRPQHFADAMLVRPIDKENYSYIVSTVTQEEIDFTKKKKDPLYWVERGYYLLDELGKKDDGLMVIARRFWFDRVGGINLARQQIFDKNGEIESDIVYGKKGALTEEAGYNLPLQVVVTRPKEKYKMRLIYQTPKDVLIGRIFPDAAFVLENRWELEEVDLDEKLLEITNQIKKQNETDNKKTN